MKLSGSIDGLGRRPAAALAVICFAACMIVGCALPGVIYSSVRYPVGLEFIEAKTGQSTFVPSGSMRERAVGVGVAGGCFTLERTGRQLVARVRAANGQSLRSRQIPLLTEGYAGPDIIVSRDLNVIAYRDFTRRALRVYALDSGKNQDVLTNLTAVGFMHFVEHDQLLVVANDDDGASRETRTSSVRIVDTATREVRTIVQLKGSSLGHQFSVSPNGRYLAVARLQFSRTEPSTVQIFDLQQGREIAAVRDIAVGYIGCVAVRDDGQAVAWYRHGRDSHTLVTATLARGETPREVRSYSDQNALSLAFTGADSLVFTRGQSRDHDPMKFLVTVDRNTGEERILAKKAFNGPVLVMPAPLTFVCHTGY